MSLTVDTEYGQTAQMLQQEWRMPDPQQQLPFAGHVRIHALIKILNKGLDLHDMQRRTIRVCQPPPPPLDAPW